MSKVKTTRVWNGLPVDEITNTETGVVELYSQPTKGAMGSTTPGTLFATGDDKGKWSYNDQAGFRRGYNNKQRTQGKPTLTQEDFNKKFFTEGTKIFNNDRANVLNTETNYETKELFNSKTSAYSTNGIPGVKNSETGDKNNSDGKTVANPDKNTDEEEVAGSEQGGNSSGDSLPERANPWEGTKSSDILRYPIGKIENGFDYDFIQFIACKYKSGEVTTKGKIDPRVGTDLETIILPMIPSLSETNVVGWNKDQMNPLQAAGANILTSGLNANLDGINVKGTLDALGSSTQAEFKAIVNSPGLKQAAIAKAAGMATGTNLLARTAGQIINPNMELLFEGPSLRSFKFNFKFRPRDPKEAEMVKKIIRSFKRNMAVQRNSGELFLLTPNIFKIKYLHKGGDHPFMNRLMPCACTEFSVGYTPDNNYMTYADGSMTGYDVGFVMSEIAPIFADHQAEAGGTGF